LFLVVLLGLLPPALGIEVVPKSANLLHRMQSIEKAPVARFFVKEHWRIAGDAIDIMENTGNDKMMVE
jgi:hypothetical protein